MGLKLVEGAFLLHLLCILVVSVNAADLKNLNIWPMPQSVTHGYGNLHFSNEFELITHGSKYADTSSILKDAFKRSIDTVRSSHVIEPISSKVDPLLVLKGIHVVVLSPSDEVQPLLALKNSNLRDTNGSLGSMWKYFSEFQGHSNFVFFSSPPV